MKWLILLALVGIIFIFVAMRFRRQIQMAMQVWQMFRQIKTTTQPIEKQISKREKVENKTLVRCAKCGTWLEQSEALNLRSKMYYCSANCVEKAVVSN